MIMQERCSTFFKLDLRSSKDDDRYVSAYGAEKVCVNIHPAALQLQGILQEIALLRKKQNKTLAEQQQLDQRKQQLRLYMMQFDQYKQQVRQAGGKIEIESMKIICNRKAFPQDAESRYRLLHHEVAGLAAIEVNNGTLQSDYYLSNQIGGFLENVMVKRLRIAPQAASKTDEKRMMRCVGTWQTPDNQWTLKRRKDFVITAFDGGETYVSEIISPLGATSSREITGGVKGAWKYRSYGTDKIARIFTGYDQSPKVRVQKQKTPIDLDHLMNTSNEVHAQPVTLFGESLFLNFNGDRGGYLWRWNGSIGGMALKCESLSRTYPIQALDQYQKYMDQLSTQGWVRLSREVENQDDEFRTNDSLGKWMPAPRKAN